MEPVAVESFVSKDWIGSPNNPGWPENPSTGAKAAVLFDGNAMATHDWSRCFQGLTTEVVLWPHENLMMFVFYINDVDCPETAPLNQGASLNIMQIVTPPALRTNSGRPTATSISLEPLVSNLRETTSNKANVTSSSTGISGSLFSVAPSTATNETAQTYGLLETGTAPTVVNASTRVLSPTVSSPPASNPAPPSPTPPSPAAPSPAATNPAPSGPPPSGPPPHAPPEAGSGSEESSVDVTGDQGSGAAES